MGTELVFSLHVVSTGDRFFTGPASRNPDGVVHARASQWLGTPTIPTQGVVIGFEDLFGGGDSDFNDYRFVVSNVTVDASPIPEPASMLLLGAGLSALGARRWRNRRQKSAYE